MATITGTAKRERTRHGFATITLTGDISPYSRWRQRWLGWAAGRPAVGETTDFGTAKAAECRLEP